MRSTVAPSSLSICPDCGSALVQPTLWEQLEDRSRWRVHRRCPECEWGCEGVHDQVEVNAFEAQLDHGLHTLAVALRSLERANMSAMTESFIVALSNDLISADDFA